VGSSQVNNDSSTCNIPPTAAVALNGSKAYAMIYRRSAAEAFGTPTYTKAGTMAASWVEHSKTQNNGSGHEIYIAKADVESTETVGLNFSLTSSAKDIGGIIIVISPTVANAPVVSDPGEVVTAIGHAEPIGTLVTVSDPDSNLATIRYQCTEANADITVTLDGAATISRGTNGTHDLTVNGTHTELLNTHATAVYTPTIAGVDTGVTITAFDGALTTARTFTITTYYMTVEATSQALLTTAMQSLTAENAVVQTSTLTVIGTDAGGRTGQNSADVVTIDHTLKTGAENVLIGLSEDVDFVNTVEASDSITLGVTDSGMGNAPINVIPSKLVLRVNTQTPIVGLGIISTGNILTVQLTVTNGTLIVDVTGGATITAGASGTSTFTLGFPSSLGEMNAALATVEFNPTTDYVGFATLTMITTNVVGQTDTDTMSFQIQSPWAVGITPFNEVMG
jgi:hypothetical protein